MNMFSGFDLTCFRKSHKNHKTDELVTDDAQQAGSISDRGIHFDWNAIVLV